MLSHGNVLLVKKRLLVAAPHLFHFNFFFTFSVVYIVVRHDNVLCFFICHSTLQSNWYTLLDLL
jgi:putative AlgH/UPF0301 family transcriptional regulator